MYRYNLHQECTSTVYIKESKEHIVKLQCTSSEAKSTVYSCSVLQGKQRTRCRVTMYKSTVFLVQVRNPILEINFDHGEVWTRQSPLKSKYIKSSSIYTLKLCTPIVTQLACYAVDGGWAATKAWKPVLKASIV